MRGARAGDRNAPAAGPPGPRVGSVAGMGAGPGDDDAADQVLDALRAGTGALLTGVAGSGAGALAERAAGALAEDGWQVLRVPGHPGVRGRPLAALALAGWAARPAPGDPLGPATARVLEAVGAGRAVLLSRRADLLDEESRAVLATVAEQTGSLPLVTSRPARANRVAASRAAGAVPLVGVAVPPLRFDALLAVLTEELGGPPAPDAAARVYALSAGVPGVARAVVAGARRAGRLVLVDGVWTAVADLRTPGLVTVVDALLEGLDGPARSAVAVLATLGPASPAVVRRVLEWDDLAALEDAGVVRVVDAGDRTEVVVVPPLVAEHLLAVGGRVEAARAREQVERALATTPGGAGAAAGDARVAAPVSGVAGVAAPASVPAAAPVPAPGGVPAAGAQPDGRGARLGDPSAQPDGSGARWAESREGVAVLGRALRRAAATRLAVRRAEWEDEPDAGTAVPFLDALARAGADRREVEAAVAAARDRVGSAGRAAVDEWHARYLGLACGEVDAALAVPVPQDAAGRRSRRRLELLLGVGSGAQHAGEDAGAERDDGTGAERPDGWLLLARGRALDALDALDATDPPAGPTAPDPDEHAARWLAVLLAGRIDEAVRDASRALDEARAALDGPAIELGAAVVALGLALAGRSRELREHLPGALALGSTAPLQPWARAGLLCIGSSLAAADGRVVAAQALRDGLVAMRLPVGPVPLTSATLASTRVTVASGTDPRRDAEALWAEVELDLDRGFVPAAVLSGSAAAEVLPDHPSAARVAAAASQAQGTLLPVLGRYVAALASGSPDEAARVAPELRAAGLRVHAVRAHARAASLAALQGDPAAAREQLRAAEAVIAEAGGDLDRALDAVGPVAGLSARELEIARLVAGGASNRQVAETLGVSVRTVDNHLYRIYRKVGVSDRESLARRIH